MTGISKEDVLAWFQDLNASHRVELLCALLDHSLPFELRFLGSVIENLGRKDFHVLRDAECKANSLHSSEASQDQANILKFLTEGPNVGAISMQAVNACSNTTANHTVQVASVNEVSATRPGISLKSEQKGSTGDGSKSTLESLPVENGLSSKSASVGRSIVSPDTKANDISTVRLEHKGDGISDDENDSKRDVWLYDQTKRRKLILYLSLLQATNHDSANSYYLLLSDVEELLQKNWLEELEEITQDEILLLYTIGSQHPAFTFEQRFLLSTVLNRFKECLIRYSKSYVHGYPSPSSPLPNQILNHLYIPPQQFEKGVYYPVYCPATQIVQQPIPSSQSANSQPGPPTDAVRQITYSFVYPSYQVFMPAPNHGSVNHHPQQFPTHPFPHNATPPHLPMQGTIVPPNGLPTQVTPIPPSTLPLPSQSPVGLGAAALHKSHTANSGHPSGSTQSHQSSISTPTRTSSMASGVTAYQSQENSLDGDSEGSCTWDSPESSPFESPPQSLTPSRSQSSTNVLSSVNTSAYGNSIVSSNPVSSSPTYPLVAAQHQIVSSNPVPSLPTYPVAAAQHQIVSSNPVSSSSTYPLVGAQHQIARHNPSVTTAASNSFTGCVEDYYNGSSSAGVIAATTRYGNVLEGSSSSMHSQSSQGRQSKSNTPSNNQQQVQNNVIVHPTSVPSPQQQQQHLMQQQIVNHLHSPSGQANAVVTHSMNTPILTYGHPAGGLTSHGGHASYSGYPTTGGMNFGGIGGPGYRTGAQVSMINRSNAFIQAHPGQMLNNPLAMKQDIRNHVGTGHNSIRQKNPSPKPKQNTSKRRTSNTATNNSSLRNSSNSLNQNNGKEESNDIGSKFQGQNLAALDNALMPPLDDPLDVNCRPRKISCYNCGSSAHVGPECKEASMEEMTSKQYRLNYGGPSADSKDAAK